MSLSPPQGKRSYKKRELSAEEQRVTWLLDFIERDLLSLRAGERLDLQDDMNRLLALRDASIDLASVTPPDGYAFALDQRKAKTSASWTETTVTSVQTKLKAGVARLKAGREWKPFTEPLTPVFTVAADGEVVRRYSGSYEEIMVAAAVDLLVAFWPRIRRCELTSCGRLFLLEDGRQRFHAPECAKQARLEKPKERDYVRETANAARLERMKGKKSQTKGRSR